MWSQTLMQVQPVVAVRHSRSNIFRVISILLLTWISAPTNSQLAVPQPAPFSPTESEAQGYLARIGFNDPDQLSLALDRVQMFFDDQGADAPLAPIAVVVHGPEVSVFAKENYGEYKSIVDKAARLTALGVLDLAVCEIRLNSKRIKTEEVHPFVKTVPFGPSEIDRLLEEENYVYF